MSISSEITRLSGNVAAALTAIGAKGVTVPSGANSDDLATLIAQIEGGGSVTWETKSDQGITIVADNPNYFILTYTEALGADETYRITWGENGTQYICETIVDPIDFTQDGYYLGNAAIANSAYEDSGEPFMLYRNSATRMVGVTNRAAGSWRIKIEKQVTSSARLTTKAISANGTYNASSDGADGYSQVTVNVSGGGSSMNMQVDNTNHRVSGTTLTDTGASITVSAAGTYDIYWSAFRSSTSSGTNGTRYYKNGSAQGSENTTWENSYCQSNKVSGVSLAKDDVIKIYGRASSNSRYVCVSNLTIVQTA